MISFTYLLSFLFKSESTAQNFVILINFLFGALGGTIVMVLRILEDTISIGKALAFIFRLIPSFCFSYGFNQLLTIKLLYSIDFPSTFQNMPSDSLNLNYVGLDILFLGIEFIIYTLLLIFCESINNKAFCIEKKIITEKVDVNDSVVLKEIEKVNSDIENSKLKK